MRLLDRAKGEKGWDPWYPEVRSHSRSRPVSLPICTVPEVSCVHNGLRVPNGETWKPDVCLICICHNGEVVCDDVECKEDLDCPNPQIPEGECCAFCPEEYGTVLVLGLREVEVPPQPVSCKPITPQVP